MLSSIPFYSNLMCYLQKYAFNPDYFNVEWCDNITTMEKYKSFYEIPDLNTYLNGSEAINGISAEFVADVQIILEKFDNNTYVTRTIMNLVSDFSEGKVEYFLYLNFMPKNANRFSVIFFSNFY